ncbi:MAG: type 1 glutamine amidotransferase domain-containing protein [Gemmatimonadota bacterium]
MSNVEAQDGAKRILMVVANATESPVTGWPVGFWWAELSHPYWAFVEAGYTVDIASPDGGDLSADGFSDPDHESGYSAADLLSRGFKSSPAHAPLLEGTPALADVDVSAYDAVFFVGGQAPMISYRGNEDLQRFVAESLEGGRVTALVCHATCLLLEARDAAGQLVVNGRTWTGFADAEERYADEFVGQRIQPFWIEEEARAIEGTNFVVDQPFRPFAVRDGLLVTGQQQASGAAAARLVIEALGTA